MPWHCDSASHIGDRAEQQDRIKVLTLAQRPQDCLVVLADGMGGRQGGALAAQTVIDTASSLFSENAARDPKGFLQTLCVNAHDKILDIAKTNGNNPASTCVALFLCSNEAYWVHVGDSRLYHFKGETPLSHTRDHTVVELLRDNDIQDNTTDHKGDQLYMCLGGENELNPEFGATAIDMDDWFILSSDGFWNHVTADEVAQQVVGTDKPEDDCAERLTNIAAERAGTGGDNTSLVILTRQHETQPTGWRRFLPRRLRNAR